MDTQETNKIYNIIILCLLFNTLSLACDPLDFRLISYHQYIFTGAALIFPALYIISDLITRVCGRYMGVRLILLFHVFDGLFTYVLYWINLLPSPINFKLMNSFQSIFSPMPRLFWSGILGDLIAAVVEILIYAYIQQRTKNFFIASVSAAIIILFAHNLPTDYFTFHKIFPNIYGQLIIFNFTINCLTVIIFSLALSVLLHFNKFRLFYHNAGTI